MHLVARSSCETARASDGLESHRLRPSSSEFDGNASMGSGNLADHADISVERGELSGVGKRGFLEPPRSWGYMLALLW